MTGAAHRTRSRPAAAAPLLRALHAATFLGLTALALAAARHEWAQLYASQRAPYHFGAPPHLAPLLCAALGALAGLGVLVQLARRRAVPLAVSAAVLLALGGTLASLPRSPPAGRSFAAGDLAILATARALHGRMVEVLRREGRVPGELDRWEAALREVAPAPSPARDRLLRAVPYRLVWQPGDTPAAAPLAPAQLRVRVPADQLSFELTAIGFDPRGDVAPLADGRGAPVVLRGAFNPDGAAEPEQM